MVIWMMITLYSRREVQAKMLKLTLRRDQASNWKLLQRRNQLRQKKKYYRRKNRKNKMNRKKKKLRKKKRKKVTAI